MREVLVAEELVYRENGNNEIAFENRHVRTS
jgi:hypothetical protein